MEDIKQAFLEIVANVRCHLEFQKALGVTAIETPVPNAVRQQEVNRPELVPSAPAVRTPAKIAPVPPLAKEPAVRVTQEGSSTSALSATLDDVRNEMLNCKQCKLSANREYTVFGEGDPAAKLVFIGEWPGPEEDEQRKPFMGAAGKLLIDIIVKGLKLKQEDVYLCNIVKCRPMNKRWPEPDEIKACERFLIQQLKAIKPKIIVALGGSVAQALLKTDEEIAALRGKWRKYQDIMLMPTLHPTDLLKNPLDKKFVWEDIKKVIVELEK